MRKEYISNRTARYYGRSVPLHCKTKKTLNPVNLSQLVQDVIKSSVAIWGLNEHLKRRVTLSSVCN